MMKYTLQEISWVDILKIWETKLWIGRKSSIRNMSSMVCCEPDNYDMSIYEKYTPSFFGVYDGELLIGVNSGHRTNDEYYRSRGLYIRVQYRGKGISHLLFDAIDKQAISERCKYVWSLPRKSAVPAYEASGYIKTSDFIDEEVEFGPNCYVIKNITLI